MVVGGGGGGGGGGIELSNSSAIFSFRDEIHSVPKYEIHIAEDLNMCYVLDCSNRPWYYCAN